MYICTFTAKTTVPQKKRKLITLRKKILQKQALVPWYWLALILPLNWVVVIHYGFVDLASREPKVGGGIYQWSGLEKVTKWDIVKLIAQHTGLRLVILDPVDVPCVQCPELRILSDKCHIFVSLIS